MIAKEKKKKDVRKEQTIRRRQYKIRGEELIRNMKKILIKFRKVKSSSKKKTTGIITFLYHHFCSIVDHVLPPPIPPFFSCIQHFCHISFMIMTKKK